MLFLHSFLMTILNIPWHECKKITDEEDRKFLLSKAEEVKEHLMRQQEHERKMREQETSSIISPI